MVKTYLRYVPTAQLGVVTSPAAGVSLDRTGTIAFTGQLEAVGIISVRRGVQQLSLTAPGKDVSATAEVTATCASPNGRHVAAGYSDGMIRIFDHAKGTLSVVLNGHKKSVTCLAFSSDGTQLASGARDTDIIIWDIVAEAGLCRLRGHKDEVTDVAFLDARADAGDPAARNGVHRYVVSCSKDTLLKVWELGNGGHGAACVQTLVGARSEVWSLAVCPALVSNDGVQCGDRLLAGAGDNQLRVWAVGPRRPVAGAAGALGESSSSSSDSSSAGGASTPAVLVPLGSLTRQSSDRVGNVRLSPDGRFAAVQGAGGSKMVELYRRRDAAETRRRVQRRLRRHREKLARREKERAAAKAASSALGASSASAAILGDGDAVGDDPMLWGDEEEGGSSFLAGTTLADLDAALERLEAEAAREVEGGAPSTAASAGVSAAAEAARLVIASDEWELVGITQARSKITGVAVLPTSSAAAGGNVATAPDAPVQLLLSTSDNQLELYAQPVTKEQGAALSAPLITLSNGAQVFSGVHRRSVASGGAHRSDVRAVAVSSDGSLVLSGSTGTARVWNAKTGACVRSLDLEVWGGAARKSPGEAEGGDDSEEDEDGGVSGSGGVPLAAGVSGGSVALCVAFAPGNRHALVGTKDGRLLLFDLASGDLLESHPAHSGPLWSISLRPDGKGLATGSADKDVKFWDFDLRPAGQAAAPAAAGKEEGGKKGKKAAPAPAVAGGPQQLTLVHSRTLAMTDEVLVVRHSGGSDPSKLLLAVALLDCTVKVFFEDSLKFALSLYGHKLPVMAMDVSADSTLLVTASADKSVKLWGLDFGDCHHSFLAHADSAMAVGFVANTHYFFTAGKDRALKYWDGDRFVGITEAPPLHKGEVWALAVAPDGSFVATGSHDRSVRLWSRSEEQVFLEEEREAALERAIDRHTRDPDGEDVLAAGDAVGPTGADGHAVRPSDGGEEGGRVKVVAAPLAGSGGPGLADASTVVAHATAETVKGTDRLLDALALATSEADKWTEYAQDIAAAKAHGDSDADIAPPARNPLLLGLTPSAYLLRTLRGIRPSDVDQVLLVLPFSDALRLLRYLHHLLARRQGVELCCRAVLLLLRVHQAQLVASATLLPLLASLRAAMHGALGSHKDLVGFNVAGLRFLDKALASAGVTPAPMPGQATDGDGKGKSGKERGIRAGKRQKVQMF